MNNADQDSTGWEKCFNVIAAFAIIGFFIYLPYSDPNTSFDWRAPTQSYYAWKYGVPAAAVTNLPRPHDCDFLSAPLGDKNCSYERRVTRTLVTVSRYGQPLRSTDDGQSWQHFEPKQPLKGQWEFEADGNFRSYVGYGDPRYATNWIHPGISGLERLDSYGRAAAIASVEPGSADRHVVAIKLGWQRLNND